MAKKPICMGQWNIICQTSGKPEKKTRELKKVSYMQNDENEKWM